MDLAFDASPGGDEAVSAEVVHAPPPSGQEVASLRARSTRDALALGWWEQYEDDSPNTARRYERDIKQFFAWADASGYDVFTMIPWHIQQYRRWLGEPDRVERYRKKTQLSDSTIAGRLAAISSFYRYCQEQAGRQGFVPNPARNIRRPKPSKESLTAGLTRDQVDAILVVARKRGPREYALVLLLVTVGLRISEVCDLDTGDLVKDSGRWALKVKRKGQGRDRVTVTCPDTTARALWRYMRGRRGAMFRGNDAERMTRRQASHWVVRMAAAALGSPNDLQNPGPRVTPHSFRHTATTLALDAGVPMADVAAQMGHTSTQTTARYDRANRRLDNPAALKLGQMFDDGTTDDETEQM